LCIAVLLSTFE